MQIYWSGNGRFQKEYEEMYEALVPNEGDASSEIGQILRHASRIYHDIYNNGGMNFSILKGARDYLKRRIPKFLPTAEELGITDFENKLLYVDQNKATEQELEEVLDVIIRYVQYRFEKEYIEPNLKELVSLLQRHPPEYIGQTKADFDRLMDKISVGFSQQTA